jgi:hypothetical protein
MLSILMLSILKYKMSENELNDFFRYQYYLNFITECISLTNPPNFDYNNLIPIIMDYYFISEVDSKPATIIECGGNCNYSLKDNCVVEFSTIFEAEECFVENMSHFNAMFDFDYKDRILKWKIELEKLNELYSDLNEDKISVCFAFSWFKPTRNLQNMQEVKQF